MSSFVQSALGEKVVIQDFPYWAVKLSDGRWLCELDVRFEPRSGLGRPFDWTLDLVDTGDIAKVREIWLMCPPNQKSPLGNTARLPIREPGTAFQFKINNLDGFGTVYKSMESIIIGRVDNKETGEATCFIWDAQLRVMSTPWQTSVYHFGSWRQEIAPIGALNQKALGLSLG